MDPISGFFALLIAILAICLMFAVIGIKKRLDEQKIVLNKILSTIEIKNQASAKPNDSHLKDTWKNEEQLMKRYAITKEGDMYCFGGYFYENLSEAIVKSEEELMKRYRITKDGEIYWFGGERYEKLSDAVDYAQSLEARKD